jgi:hypothetical protein
MSQTLLNSAQPEIRENKQFLSSKKGIFFFPETGKRKKMLHSTAIYNLPPLQRNKIIMETSLRK